MKLGKCTILFPVAGVRGEDTYEVEVDDTGTRMAVRVTSRAVPPMSAAAEESAQFLDAAATAATLDHPNVRGIVDYGEQDGIRYLIEPRMDGSLLEFLTSGQSLPLPVPLARGIVEDASAGLQYLHDCGIVHGRVHVRSLFFRNSLAEGNTTADGTFTPRIVVGELGLHRFLDDGTDAKTEKFEEFVAPEQHHDGTVAASDQFAVAVLAHLLLTGRMPVISSRSRPIEDIEPGDLVPPSKLNPTLPPAVDFLLLTALNPDPAQRFRRIQDFAAALAIATGAATRSGPYASGTAHRPPGAAPQDTPPPTYGTAPPPPGGMPEEYEGLSGVGAGSLEIAAMQQAAPQAMTPSAASISTPPVATKPPEEPIYRLPKAPPYTAPVRAVKVASAVAPKATRLPRRRVLLGIAGGVVGAAALGGAGYYLLSQRLHGALGLFPGSGRPDSIGFFRASQQRFLLLSSLATRELDIVVRFGQTGDLPVAGDWIGNGVDTLGVFRPANGAFYLTDANHTTPQVTHTISFGAPGDLPVAGDWTGRGRDSIGVYRPSLGQFLLLESLDPGARRIVFGVGKAGDLPVAGKWNGGGATGVGLYRPSEDTFRLWTHVQAPRPPTPDYVVRLGVGTGLPIAGDWRGSGRSGVGLFLPSSRTLHLKQNLTDAGAPETKLTLGDSGDLPIAGRWS